jgi:hypothetical protein
MTELQKIIWAAGCGAAAGTFTSLLVTLITVLTLPRLRRWNLTKQVSIVTDPPHNGHARLRVVNGGYWTVADAMLYLHLDIKEEDVLQPPPGLQAHIQPNSFVPLPESGEQLCWSVTPNPMKVAILAKERQPFSPCKITAEYIMIPSESGWPPNTVRVFLQPHEYSGTLLLVSADTDGRKFRVHLNPNSVTAPFTVTPWS